MSGTQEDLKSEDRTGQSDYEDSVKVQWPATPCLWFAEDEVDMLQKKSCSE